MTGVRSTAAGLAAALLAQTPAPAAAQANTPFVGQIMTTAANFCPTGWVPAQGQLLSIADNDTLFMLYGTRYGGDGTTTFAVPALKPIVPVQGTPFLTCISLFGVYPSQP